MGVIVEFYAVLPGALSPPLPDDIRSRAGATAAKYVGALSINSRAVAEVYGALQGSILDGIAGDGSTAQNAVLVDTSHLTQVEGLANSLLANPALNDALRALANALLDAAAGARWHRGDLLVIGT